MSQLTISATMAVAFAGQLYGLEEADTETAVQAEASAEIPFGVLVAYGTLETDGILFGASNAKPFGILVHQHIYDPYTDLGTVGLKPKTVMNLARSGKLWVYTETAVVPGDRAHVRYAAGAGGTQKGAFRNAAVTNETVDLTACIRFMRTASANSLVPIEFDFLNK